MPDVNIMISVVVPIYNVENYLNKCIESILNQTYKKYEIILVDDGSTDRCPEICDHYLKIDNRIQVIHKKNGGLVSARKVGTAAAKGDYIVNIDADDWIEEDRFEVLVSEGIETANADMIYLSGHKKDYSSTSMIIDSNIPVKTFYKEEIKKQIFPLLIDFKEGFITGVKCILWQWAVKRELLQEMQKIVDERITMGEDIICVWFCLLSARSVTFIKHDGYHYVQRRSSMVYRAATSPEEGYLGIKIWYHQLKKYLERHNNLEEIRRTFIYATIWNIMLANYGLLLEKHSQYLFPFTKVKKGYKIVLYGAGRMGHALMLHILKNKNYQLVLWVDQNENGNIFLGYKVSSVEDIMKVDYDYIVIAVMNADLVKEIKFSLISKGVFEDKIATMDASVITEEAIPNEIIKD